MILKLLLLLNLLQPILYDTGMSWSGGAEKRYSDREEWRRYVARCVTRDEPTTTTFL